MAVGGVRYLCDSRCSVDLQSDPSLVDCSKAAREDSDGFVVVPDFVSPEEEALLCQDINRTLRGKKYQYDHWDKVITSSLRQSGLAGTGVHQ